MRNLEGTAADYYYGHDHLYSPVVLFEDDGDVVERYEYDAYGTATVYTNMSDWDSATPTTQGYSNYSNPYLFTGRRLDILDGGDLKIMYYRARYYDPYTGRFLQRDPLGIDPAGGKQNSFAVNRQYTDSANLYEYVLSNPVAGKDSFGLIGFYDDPWAPEPPIPPARPIAIPIITIGDTTFGGIWCVCPNAKKAIDIANKALSLGDCGDWFKKRGARGEKYRVNIKRYFAAFEAGTWPVTRDMYLAQRACKKSPDYLATLLIHEVAHHYSQLVIFGGDTQANEAAEQCADEISDAAQKEKCTE